VPQSLCSATLHLVVQHQKTAAAYSAPRKCATTTFGIHYGRHEESRMPIDPHRHGPWNMCMFCINRTGQRTIANVVWVP